jgi:ribosome-associated protein
MHDDDEEELAPSKSALKREMTALQKVGEQLVGLSERELARMPIADEQLEEAITLARRIKSNSGRRRQLQYIGKLMRGIDASELVAALEDLHQQGQAEAKAFQQLEAQREQILEGSAEAIEAVLQDYPHADRQQLRQMQRQHQKEQSTNKPRVASRKLFKYLRELSESGDG